MRLPFNMSGPASIISDSAINGSSNYNYHPCIVVGSFVGTHSVINPFIVDMGGNPPVSFSRRVSVY